MDTEFLPVADVLEIHADRTARYGGDPGSRDLGPLESAVMQAQVMFNARSLYTDIFEMAVDYTLCLTQNPPLLDGNKRVGAVAALVFLDFNGAVITAPKGRLYERTMRIGKGRIQKAESAAFFPSSSHPE